MADVRRGCPGCMDCGGSPCECENPAHELTHYDVTIAHPAVTGNCLSPDGPGTCMELWGGVLGNSPQAGWASTNFAGLMRTEIITPKSFIEQQPDGDGCTPLTTTFAECEAWGGEKLQGWTGLAAGPDRTCTDYVNVFAFRVVGRQVTNEVPFGDPHFGEYQYVTRFALDLNFYGRVHWWEPPCQAANLLASWFDSYSDTAKYHNGPVIDPLGPLFCCQPWYGKRDLWAGQYDGNVQPCPPHYLRWAAFPMPCFEKKPTPGGGGKFGSTLGEPGPAEPPGAAGASEFWAAVASATKQAQRSDSDQARLIADHCDSCPDQVLLENDTPACKRLKGCGGKAGACRAQFVELLRSGHCVEWGMA